MKAQLLCTSDSPDRLRLRRGGIGSSDSANVLNLGYDSPLGLYWRKRGEIPDTSETRSMEWGTRLEPVIAAKFADRHPEYEVRPSGLYAHPDAPHRLANPDRELYKHGSDEADALLEIKTARHGAPGWGRDGTSEVPGYVTIQANKQLHVTDLTVAYVAVLIGGQDYREYQLTRDDDLCQSIADADDEFWRRVQEGIEPVADFSDATADALAERYPEAAEGTEVVLPPMAYDLLDAYQAAHADEKDAARRKAEAMNQLKQLLGDAEVGLLDSAPVVRWGNTSRRSVTDMDALAANHPEYVTATTSRRLTVKGKQ